VARIAESMGFRVILAGGASRLPGCDAEVLHRPAGCRKLKVLFRHDRLSDDLALHPSGAEGQAVAADEFARRLADGYHADEVINLFMDYETFIGHDPGKTGLPGFLETVPGILMKRRNWRFSTPSGAAAEHEPAAEIDVPGQIFRTGSERDGSACLGNHLQIDAARTLYGLEERVRATKSRTRIGAWRNLQASDYFCHMNTEHLASGAVHRTLNPFASPYDAYIHYMNILKDFSGRIAGKTGVRP
jgi:alpha-amylase